MRYWNMWAIVDEDGRTYPLTISDTILGCVRAYEYMLKYKQDHEELKDNLKPKKIVIIEGWIE